VRVVGQRRCRQLFHFRHQGHCLLVWCAVGRQDGAIPLGFDRKGKYHSATRPSLRLEFHSVVKIEVTKIVLGFDLDQVAIDLVIHFGSQLSKLLLRPAASN